MFIKNSENLGNLNTNDFSWNPLDIRLDIMLNNMKEIMINIYFIDNGEFVSVEKIFKDLIGNYSIYTNYNQEKIKDCIRDIAFLNPSSFILTKDENYIKKIIFLQN